MAYDLIIVGSGNGACGFLNFYQKSNSNLSYTDRGKILVLEEGEDFFSASDITHQKNWTKSYTEESIFKLHQSFTPKGLPVISGRACTMGGGSSINYSMIHESSEWLAKHIGRTEAYWDSLKLELNQSFQRPDPTQNLSSATHHVIKKAQEAGFQLSSSSLMQNIPNHQESDTELLHIFATQFNAFGQRVHSGVSIVDWGDPQIELKTQYKVVELRVSQGQEGEITCIGVKAQNIKTKEICCFPLNANGRLILCAGAGTPRVLMPYRQQLQNNEIGKYVSDHISIPLGIYTLDRDKIDATQRDNYVPVFATTTWKPEQQGNEILCTFDFFAGDLPQLLFFFPQLYFSFFVKCRWLKSIIIKSPRLFYLTKNLIREMIKILNQIINIGWSISDILKCKSWKHDDIPLITAILKFNPGIEGSYSEQSSKIELELFSEDGNSQFNQDKEVAKDILRQHLSLINSLGKPPPWIIKCLFRHITKIPYEEKHIDHYIDAVSKGYLGTEQHLSGGCLFGKAIDQGLKHPQNTGKVHGSTNMFVADLSSVALPRVSPQMTAYIVGFHVAKMLYE